MIQGYRMAGPPPHGEPPKPVAEAKWPPWLGLATLLAVFVVQVLAASIAVIVTDVPPGGDLGADATLVLGFVASLSFLGGALIAARLVMPLHPWQFGLKPTRFWPAVGWTALGLAVFWALLLLYAAIAGAPEQTTADDIGADTSDVRLIAAGVLFVVLAPICEELFFRGLLYGALRNALRPGWAMLVVGVVFGVLHFSSGIEAVPPLIVLGVVFCWVYEKTGSLYPCIALHALNNSLAYMGQTDVAPAIAGAFGIVMVGASALLPRFVWRRPPAQA